MYNIVLLCPDDLPSDVAKAHGNVNEMKKLFEDWDPCLIRFLNLVDQVDKWRLFLRADIPSWIHPSNKFVMIGDSCHAMVPYLAQGANSALEDGAVLGSLLSKIQTNDELPQVLKVFEVIRKSRVEGIVAASMKQRQNFHMPDGPAQKERDMIFENFWGKKPTGEFPSQWTCPITQPWLYAYDAYAEVEKIWGKEISQQSIQSYQNGTS